MDNVPEPYDLITVLWRLEGFKTIEGEIGQGQSIDERGARHRYRADGSFAKATCIAPMLGGAAAPTIHDHVSALRGSSPLLAGFIATCDYRTSASGACHTALLCRHLQGMSDLFQQA